MHAKEIDDLVQSAFAKIYSGGQVGIENESMYHQLLWSILKLSPIAEAALDSQCNVEMQKLPPEEQEQAMQYIPQYKAAKKAEFTEIFEDVMLLIESALMSRALQISGDQSTYKLAAKITEHENTWIRNLSKCTL
jgi:hypothetical protein